jgi:hypothetical protein
LAKTKAGSALRVLSIGRRVGMLRGNACGAIDFHYQEFCATGRAMKDGWTSDKQKI